MTTVRRDVRIVPSADGKFSKAQELQVVFWIYGAGAGPFSSDGPSGNIRHGSPAGRRRETPHHRRGGRPRPG